MGEILRDPVYIAALILISMALGFKPLLSLLLRARMAWNVRCTNVSPAAFSREPHPAMRDMSPWLQGEAAFLEGEGFIACGTMSRPSARVGRVYTHLWVSPDRAILAAISGGDKVRLKIASMSSKIAGGRILQTTGGTAANLAGMTESQMIYGAPAEALLRTHRARMPAFSIVPYTEDPIGDVLTLMEMHHQRDIELGYMVRRSATDVRHTWKALLKLAGPIYTKNLRETVRQGRAHGESLVMAGLPEEPMPGEIKDTQNGAGQVLAYATPNPFVRTVRHLTRIRKGFLWLTLMQSIYLFYWGYFLIEDLRQSPSYDDPLIFAFWLEIALCSAAICTCGISIFALIWASRLIGSRAATPTKTLVVSIVAAGLSIIAMQTGCFWWVSLPVGVYALVILLTTETRQYFVLRAAGQAPIQGLQK